MRKLVWFIVGIGLLIWSGLAWLVHGMVGWGGNLASGNADVLTLNPEAVEWLSWLALFGTGVGEWIVIAIWAIGAVIALAFGFLGARLLPNLGNLGQKLGTRP